MKFLVVLLLLCFSVSNAQDTSYHNPILNCGDAIPFMIKGSPEKRIVYNVYYRITSIGETGSFVFVTKRRRLPTKRKFFDIVTKIVKCKCKFSIHNFIIEHVCVSI